MYISNKRNQHTISLLFKPAKREVIARVKKKTIQKRSFTNFKNSLLFNLNFACCLIEYSFNSKQYKNNLKPK